MVPDDDALCARAGRAVLGRPIRGRRLVAAGQGARRSERGYDARRSPAYALQ
jgi:hypothetical protein